MELHQLRYFCAVVKAGSFTKAADQEGIAQPSLSQQIRRFEDSVGAPLFVRLGRSVRLTHAGSVLYPFAGDILNQAQKATIRVRHLETDVRGPLRVGVIRTVLPYLVAPHLPEFTQLYPDVDVILTEDLTGRLVEKLQSGEVDLIVSSMPMRGPDLVGSELMKDPLVLVAPKGHKLASLPHVPYLDLFGERLFLLKEGHCFREDMLTACKHGRAEMAPAYESDHFGSISPLVASGAGISIAPMMAAVHAKDCEVIPFAKPQMRRIGYARLVCGANFRRLVAFTKWLRTVASHMNHADMKDDGCNESLVSQEHLNVHV